MVFAAVTLIFALGIGNFALHKAAMESDSPVMRQLPWITRKNGKRAAFLFEFAILLAAMLLAANGWPNLAWAYLVYSALNAVSAWLIFSGRI